MTAVAQKPTDAAVWLAEIADKVRRIDPEMAAVFADEARIERDRERRRQLREQIRDARLAN